MNYLADAAYRPLEDELTRGYILTALIKLHAVMGFNDSPKVENVMFDFLSSKHLDVQQRAIEYKALRENSTSFSKDILAKIPLNEG